jgi:hypothetical protein
MMVIQCPTHQSEVLLTERRIRGIRNTEHGILMDVECYCGTHVVIRTGRKWHDEHPSATRDPVLSA